MAQIYKYDSYQRSYETRISNICVVKHKTAIACEDNIFYPKGGGQPCDTGYIKISETTLKVEKTIKMDGNVWLFLDRLFDLDVGQEVFCMLDWEKRYSNMRCHTAAHVVMSSIKRNIRDFSSDSIEIQNNFEVDLVFKGIWDNSIDKANKILNLSNNLIRQNLSVYQEDFNDVESALNKYSKIYRGSTAPSFNGLFRLVVIKDWDANPCAGTHLRELSEIGCIELLDFSSNKFKIRVNS